MEGPTADIERNIMFIPKDFIVLDLETTGSHPLNNEIIEIGAVKVKGGKVVETFNQLVQPKQEIPEYVQMLTGITTAMVAQAPEIKKVLPEFIKFCEDYVIVGHNVILFDYRMLKATAIKQGYTFEKSAIDTLMIARRCLSHLPSRKLGDLCHHYGIELTNAHRALDDAQATYELLVALIRDYYQEAPEIFRPRKIGWKVPKQGHATLKQKRFLQYLLETHKIAGDPNIETLTKSEASKEIDGIIRKYGRES